MILSMRSRFEKWYSCSISYSYTNLKSPIIHAKTATSPHSPRGFNARNHGSAAKTFSRAQTIPRRQLRKLMGTAHQISEDYPATGHSLLREQSFSLEQSLSILFCPSPYLIFLPALADRYIEHWWRGPSKPAALQAALWNWNCSTLLMKYLTWKGTRQSLTYKLRIERFSNKKPFGFYNRPSVASYPPPPAPAGTL